MLMAYGITSVPMAVKAAAAQPVFVKNVVPRYNIMRLITATMLRLPPPSRLTEMVRLPHHHRPELRNLLKMPMAFGTTSVLPAVKVELVLQLLAQDVVGH